MKLSIFATILSVAAAFFAIALLFFPVQFLNNFGITLEGGGVITARLYGSALSVFAIMSWINRNIPRSDKSWFGLLFSGIVGNTIAAIILVISINNGTANSLAWTSVLIHLFFCIGGAYFAFKKTS